jgi:hypothetical protein
MYLCHDVYMMNAANVIAAVNGNRMIDGYGGRYEVPFSRKYTLIEYTTGQYAGRSYVEMVERVNGVVTSSRQVPLATVPDHWREEIEAANDLGHEA